VCFLYKAHCRYSGTPPIRLLEYGDRPDLNDYIDSSNEPVRVFDLEYRPSEVLFFTDRQAYTEIAAGFSPESTPDSEEAL